MDAAKLAVLKAIEERKGVLFGKFSEKLSKTTKNEAWQEVSELAKSLKVLKNDQSVEHLRSTVWQNWRRTALDKRDNSKKTGSAGGKKMKMTEHDEAVYRIIGEDSKVLDGLKVAESSGSCDLPPEKENVPPNATKSSQLCSKQRAQPKSNECDEDGKQKQDLKRDWLALQCEISRKDLMLKDKELKLKDKELQLRDLQIMKLQQELNVNIEELIEEVEEEEVTG